MYGTCSLCGMAEHKVCASYSRLYEDGGGEDKRDIVPQRDGLTYIVITASLEYFINLPLPDITLHACTIPISFFALQLP